MVDSANGPVKGGTRRADPLKPREPYPFDKPRARRSHADADKGSGNRPAGEHSPSADPTETRTAWAEHAEELAAWAMKWLVNRRDAWGQYLPLDQRSKGKAVTRKGELTETVLIKHYEGVEVSDLVGLHTTSADNTSRWLAIDIDLHGEPDEEAKRRNRKAAKCLYEKTKELGFRPLLLSSNGRGGYHLILLFKQPVDTAKVFSFGKWLVRDWKELGLLEEPELFPKQSRLDEKTKYGNYLRLPGRHHTFDYYTKVWTGENWVGGKEAVQTILATKGISPERIPPKAEGFAATTPSTTVEQPPDVPPDQLERVQKRALGLIRRVKAVQGKGGDEATWMVALYLVKDFAMSVEQALPLMKEWNSTNCQPPWPEGELRRKLHRAAQEPDRGRMLKEVLKDVPSTGGNATGEGVGMPFLMEVPDFILADWIIVRPKSLARKQGRPPSASAAFAALVRAAVFAQRSSRVYIPDVVLAQLLLPGKPDPISRKGWRRALRQALKRLSKGSKLDVRFRSACHPACPLNGRSDVPHRHIRQTLGKPEVFLGLLQAFSVSAKEHRRATVYTYDFKDRKSHHPKPEIAEVLNKEIKEGAKRLWWIYLPAWLFGPVALKPGPCNVLKALTRELTRSPGRRDVPAKAQVFLGSRHSILDKAKKYVAFNGNGRGHYRGLGYKIKTWMERAGYVTDLTGTAFWEEARRFLSDLATLRQPFGLVIGGYRSDLRKWNTLDALINMTRSVEGRKWLARCRLKVFGPEDYLLVWRQYFARARGLSFIPGGRDEDAVGTVQTYEAPSAITSAVELDVWMRNRGLTNRALADALGISAAQVGYQRSGGRLWSKDFEQKLSVYLKSSAK